MTDRGKPPPKAVVRAFVALHNLIYRLSGGRIGGRYGGGPVLLLTVKGRKSGRPLTVPVLYVQTDRGYGIVASFAGSPTHPAWYLNLEAQGFAEVRIGRRSLRAKAEMVDYGSQRYTDIWRKAVAIYPDYETYRARTTRRIPIVELLPEN